MTDAEPHMRPERSFQGLILSLQRYWADFGCIILQPYDMEVGAGTFHPATTLRAHFGTGETTVLFIGPGHIPLGLLAEAARQPSVTEAVNALAGTLYGATLQGAMEKYATANRLSVFERALMRQQLQHAVGFFAADPLGIGVLLGYVVLKTNEVANLRAIAQGLMLGEKSDRIRAELMFAV